MNADQVITKAFSISQGKPVPPAQGSTKYNQLLIIVDSEQKNIVHEPSVDWSWLYQTQQLTSSSTDTFDLDDTVDYVVQDEQDPIRIGTREYKLVTPKQLYKYRNNYACAQIGQQLVFSRPIDNDVAGQTMYIPTIVKVDDITSPTDEITVDDPMCLVYMVAAEFARNDIIKIGQYSNLLAKGNNLLEKMKQGNEGSYEQIESQQFFSVDDNYLYNQNW